MDNKQKRPRLEKTKKLIDRKMYEDYNQKKPSPADPNEVKNTPLTSQPKVEEDNSLPVDPRRSPFTIHFPYQYSLDRLQSFLFRWTGVV